MRALLIALVASFAAALLAVGTLAVLVLTTGQPRPLTTGIAEWAITRAIGSPVRIGGSSGSPLFGLELSDVEIAPESPERFEIERLRIEVDSIAPTGRHFGIRRLVVAGLRIDGHRSIAGSWRWAAGELDLDSPSTAPSAPGVHVQMRELRLEDARLHLSIAREGGSDDTLEARLDAVVRRAEWPLDEQLDQLPDTELKLSEVRANAGVRSIERGAIEARLGGSETIEFAAQDLAGPWGAIESADATFEMRGTTEAPALVRASGALRFRDIDPAPLALIEMPESSLTGRSDFDWDGARFSIEARLDRSTAAGIDIEHGAFHGASWREDGALRFGVEQASVQSAIGTFEASLSGDLDGVHEGTLHAPEIDLGAWPAGSRPTWLGSGLASLDGRWHGPWSSPTGTFDLRLDAAQLAGVAVHAAHARVELIDLERVRIHALDASFPAGPLARMVAVEPFTLALVDDEWTIGDAQVDLSARLPAPDTTTVPAGRVAVRGSVSPSRFGRLRIETTGLALRVLPLATGDRFRPGGRLDGSLTVDGPRRQPRLEGHVVWASPRLGELHADRLQLELGATPATQTKPGSEAGGATQRQHAALSLVSNDLLVLDAKGSFSTRGLVDEPARLFDDDTLEFDVTLHDIGADVIAPLVSLPEPPPSGRVSGHALLRGPLQFPLLDARLSGRAIAWRQLPASDLELTIDAADPTGRAALDLTLHEQDRTPLTLHVETTDRARLATPRALALEAGSGLSVGLDHLDLAWLDAVTEVLGVTVRGDAHGDVRIASGEVPTAEGSLQVDALALTGPGLPFDLGPIPARFDFAGQVARSTELRIGSKRGDAAIRGQVAWHDPSAPVLQIKVRASDFAVDVPGVIFGRVDGDAVVEGPVMALDGRGGFELHHAQIDLPDPQNPILREIRIKHGPSGTGLAEDAGEGIYDASEGELGLAIGESVWLRGLGLELALRGELAARKEPHAPAALFGTVEVESGRVDFQGRWLRITSGSAIFDGAEDPDPFVDATAMHRVDQITLFVRLRGRASDLQLELDSEPPLPVEDQLSYLLFDRPAAEISASEQHGISTAAMAASEMLLGQFGNELGREVGLDRVRLGVDDEDTPYVEVEKRVHERVAVRYGRSFGSRGADRFVIEWRLFREIFLAGEQETDGDSGVDLFWRKDY